MELLFTPTDAERILKTRQYYKNKNLKLRLLRRNLLIGKVKAYATAMREGAWRLP